MKFEESVQGVAFVALTIFLLNQLLFSTADDDPAGNGAAMVDPASTASRTTANVEVDMDEIRRTLAPAPMLRNEAVDRHRREIDFLMERGRDLEARAALMQRAARANAVGDKRELGYVLSLLGEVSFESRDFGAAQIYLEESLDNFRAIDDTIGEAYAFMQLGRMHIKSRSVARHAGEAYNLMLLARYQLSHFQYENAEQNLRRVVEASLAIDRYGTAASALSSLARAMYETGRTYQAEQAVFDAAELYAASGRERKANQLLDDLVAAGVDPYRVERRREAVVEALAQFERDTRQVVQARDYRTLYYQYRNAGSEERAWQFRVKAADVLAQTSKRAMYFRQPDVMAILYNSNFAMANARRFVDHARSLFDAQGEREYADRAAGLSEQIF